jgi:hypothetical protein
MLLLFRLHLRRAVGVLAVLLTVSGAAWADLPASYDLRDYGWITPVEDQGQLGTCWAFSSTTAFQSSALREGLITDPASPLVDFSIWHLATRNGNVTDLSYPYDGWGGWNDYSTGYWTRGSGEWNVTGLALPVGGGPVLNSSNPLNVYPIDAVANREDLTPYVPPSVQPLASVHLKAAPSYSYAPAGAISAAYRDQIKQAAMTYGTLSVSMFAGSNTTSFSSSWDPAGDGYRYSGSEGANHAVAIAGWNDAKQITVGGVTTTGAWLVQNSWGADFGDDGYFWIAYEDTGALHHAGAYFVEAGGKYSSTTLQNQIFAPEKKRGSAAGDSIAASSMMSDSDAELLTLGLWSTAANSRVNLTIYDDWGTAGPQGGPLLTMSNISLATEGYLEFDLSAPLFLHGGDAIYLVFDFGGLADPVSLDARSLALEGVGDFTGRSWLYDNGSGNWDDLATGEGGGIFFLKGYTAVPEPASVVLVLIGVGWIVLRGQRIKRAG